MVGTTCRSDTDRHAEQLALERDHPCFNRGAKFLCQTKCSREADARQQNSKFFTAVSRQDTLLTLAHATDVFSQKLSDHAQHFVACGMTVRVVDQLEPVQIQHQQRTFAREVKSNSFDFTCKQRIESPSIGEIGQSVVASQSLHGGGSEHTSQRHCQQIDTPRKQPCPSAFDRIV